MMEVCGNGVIWSTLSNITVCMISVRVLAPSGRFGEPVYIPTLERSPATALRKSRPGLMLAGCSLLERAEQIFQIIRESTPPQTRVITPRSLVIYIIIIISSSIIITIIIINLPCPGNRERQMLCFVTTITLARTRPLGFSIDSCSMLGFEPNYTASGAKRLSSLLSRNIMVETEFSLIRISKLAAIT